MALLKIRRNASRIFLWLVLSLLLSGMQPLMADDATADFEQQLQTWQHTLDEAQAALDDNFLYSDSKTVAVQLEKMLQEAKDASVARQKELAYQQDKLDKLGERNTEKRDDADTEAEHDGRFVKKAAESDEVVQLRHDLEQRIAVVSGQISRVDLIVSQGSDILDHISAWERAWVRDLILQRNPLPVTMPIWRAAIKDVHTFTQRVIRSPIKWWQSYDDHNQLRFHLLWALPVFGFLLGWPIRYSILHFFGRDPEEAEPSYTRRIFKCAIDGIANAIVPVVIILSEVLLLQWMNLLDGLFGDIVYLAGFIIAAYLIVVGMARAALSPQMSQWRILPVEPAYASKLLLAISVAFGTMALALILLTSAWQANLLTPPLESAFTLVYSLIAAPALVWFLSPKYWTSSIVESQQLGTQHEHADALEEEGEAEKEETAGHRTSIWVRVIRWIRWPILLTPFLPLLGYGRLAFHIQSRLLLTIGLLGVVFLVRLVLRESLEQLFIGRKRRRGKTSKEENVSPEQDVKIMLYWAGLGLNILLLIPVIYLLLLAYGIPWITLKLWTQSLWAGIRIGSVTLSITKILSALFVLVLGLVGTSLVRRWMTRRLLPNTRLDVGARDSIAAGTGYLGVIVAVLLAIAALGINFSNLAIVAGALSVGIGFGLQNIVQNFVAGLLLLAERPFKVGDWIKVGNTQGIVKRISVRSTEVQTFERSSVFVPNSDLIANQVVNWTHDNRIARVHIKVHVAYGSDVREVEKILLQCAHDHPNVLWYPASYVWFRGFADGVLNFELRAYMNDTDNWIDVDGQLYVRIYEALRERGIAIPVPQREVHVHNYAPGTSPYATAPPTGQAEAPPST